MTFLPNCIAKIYLTPDLINAVWTGWTDANGRVIDAGGIPPSLSYGDYVITLDHCDYNLETLNFNIPQDTLLAATVGCTSSISTHEITYNHSLIGSGGLPSGIILMWHGLISNIPSGFVICNGLNGTPDLRARFVRGAPAGVEAGGTGGADTHTLTIAEMPSHSHSLPATGGMYNDNYSGSTLTRAGSSSTGASGSNSPHNNMPAYYQIIFIMKV